MAAVDYFVVGGEALTGPLMACCSKCRAQELYQLYGPTEATVDVTAGLRTDHRRHTAPSRLAVRFGTRGFIYWMG